MLFERVPSDNLGLNLDPSHLVWQFIDYVKVAKEFAKKVFHTHAKDTEIMYDKLSEVGIYRGVGGSIEYQVGEKLTGEPTLLH